MRAFMDILTEAMQEKWTYVGNCTNSHTAPYLEDMMDAAQETTYSQLARVVGIKLLAEVFPDYDWRRGRDLKMRDDYAVTYEKSTFKGMPCYYVTHSGIEFIFVRKSDYDEALDSSQPVKKSAQIYFHQDGTTAATLDNKRGYAAQAFRRGNVLHLSISGFPTPSIAHQLMKFAHTQDDGNTELVWDDEEDTFDNLDSYLNRAINALK